MIPYYSFEQLGFAAHPQVLFLRLVALGYVLGWVLMLVRARERGITFVETTIIFGIGLFATVVGAALYEQVLYGSGSIELIVPMFDPMSRGLSSFGGIFFGLIAIIAYLILTGKKSELTSWADITTQGATLGMLVGRVGCALGHDHVGGPTDFFLAVDFPFAGPHHDLGVYEVLFLLVILTPLTWYLNRSKVRDGFIAAMVCIFYGTFRLFLDSLRIEEPFYLGFAVGQYSGLVLVTIGVLVLYSVTRPLKQGSS